MLFLAKMALLASLCAQEYEGTFVRIAPKTSAAAKAPSGTRKAPKVDVTKYKFGRLVATDRNKWADVFDYRSGKTSRFQLGEALGRSTTCSAQECIAGVGVDCYIASRIEEVLGRVWPARVAVGLDRETGDVHVTQGTRDGIKKGQELLVRRDAGTIVDPVTKSKLDTRWQDVCRLEVIEVRDRSARCRMKKKIDPDSGLQKDDPDSGLKPEEGDGVQRLDEDVRVAILISSKVNIGRHVTIQDISESDAVSTLTAILVDRKVSVVERGDLQKVLDELHLQHKSDLQGKPEFDQQMARKVAKQLGANAVLIGTVKPKDLSVRGFPYLIDVRLVNVETGLIDMAIFEKN